MLNIHQKSSIFNYSIIFSKFLGGSIDPPDPSLTGPLTYQKYGKLCQFNQVDRVVFGIS